MASRRALLALAASMLSLVVMAPARADEPADLPDDWVRQRLPFTDGEMLRLESWSFEEAPSPYGVTWITAEARRPDGTYLTGMRIQLVAFPLKDSEWKSPREYADWLFERLEGDAEKVLGTCGPEVRDDITNRCISVVQRVDSLGAEEPFHIEYGIWWTRTLVVVSTFGTPESLWAEKAHIHAAMANFRLIGPNFGKAAPDASAAAGEGAPPQEAPAP